MTEEKKVDKYGIMESMEIVTYADSVLNKLVEAKADDNKIDGGEVAAALAATAPEAVKAIWGSWDAPKELGELSDEEKQRLLDASFPVVLKLFGLFIPKE